MTTINTVIADTTKGKRVWLQGLSAHGWKAGDRFNTEVVGSQLVHVKHPQGKRKVTAAKGGIIDTVGKKVTQWATTSGHTFTQAEVLIGPDTIIINRSR